MNQVGQVERITQNRVIKLFQDELGYTYLGHWADRKNNSNIEEELLKNYLARQNYTAAQINKAIYELKTIANNNNDLYSVNKRVYHSLRYGIAIKVALDENFQTIQLINWNNPKDNDFALAEEVSIKNIYTKRPDIVLYVNGIALAVLELKRTTVSIAEGIRQSIVNQKPEFIQSFFATIQT